MKNIGPEIWKPIPGHPGYEASHYGRIRSNKNGKTVILKQIVHIGSKNGRIRYLRVTLYDGMGGRKNMRVNRAVALAFIGPPPTPKHVAAHEDGNPMNNWLLNLKWATHQQNEDDKLIHGTRPRGVKVKQAKLNPASVRKIRRMYAAGKPAIELAKHFGVDRSTIYAVINGKSWSHIV